MNKIKFLILALLCCVGSSAWGEDYSFSPNYISYSKLSEMLTNSAVGTEKLIILVAENKSYILGYTGSATTSQSKNDANKLAAANDTQYRYVLRIEDNNTFSIRTETGNIYLCIDKDNTSNGIVKWLDSPSDDQHLFTTTENSGYPRIVSKKDSNRKLNTGENVGGLNWGTGTGPYTYWGLYEVYTPLQKKALDTIDEAKLIYSNTQPIIEKTGSKLITNKDQLYCNNTDPNEGSDIGALIDENPSTFHHTNWHNAGTDPHYLQVTLPEAKNTLVLDYTTRSGATNDFVKTMKVYGSNDGGTTFTEDPLTTLNFPNLGAGKTGTLSFEVGDTKYSCFKFVTTDAYPSYRTYFHFAEFQLFEGIKKIVYDVENSYVEALLAKINTLETKIIDGTFTQQDIDELNTAINNVKNNAKADYTVSITGNPSDAKITVGGKEYSNGDTFKSKPISTEDILPTVISKYSSTVTIDGSIIHVVYKLDMSQFNQISDLNTLSNSKAYYIIAHDNTRGVWTYNSSDTGWLNSTNKAGTTASILNTNQHFALLKSAKGNYYLYSIAAAKFVAYSAEEGGRAALVDNPINTITFKASTSGYESSPWVVSFVDGNATHDIGISNNYSHGVITFWNSTADGGNCVKIYDTDAAFDATAALKKIEKHEAVADFTQMNIALAKAQARLPLLGVGYGKYSEVTSGALQTAITTAQAFNQETTPASQQTDVDNATTALLNSASINVPQSGSYIRIKGETTGRYLLAGMANSKFKTGEIPSDTPDEAIFYVTESGKLQNVGSGKFNGMHKGSWSWVDTEESASSVTFSEGQGVVGKYQILSKDAYFYDADNNADRGGSNNGNVRYNSWMLEEVKSFNLTIASSGLSSLCLPFNAFVPDNTYAYYASAYADGNVTLTKVADGKIAANAGYLIKGEKETQPTVTFFQTPDAVTAPETNYLVGVTEATKITKENCYILKSGIFHPVNTAGGNLAANKAYLDLSSSDVKLNGVYFEDGEATGIYDAAKSEQSGVQNGLYNLSGQAVGNDYKGIVIKNGKKYFNK